MAGADFLNIPGNIRQIYLPFTIAGPGKLQVFSFKNNREGPAVAQIHPFPRTFEQLFLADSGFQYSHGPKGSNKIEYKDFLNNIPSFQIREFVPDARLTQTFKWFTYFKRGADAAVSGIDFESFNWSKAKEIVGEAMDALSEKMRELTSGDAKLLVEVAGGLRHYYRDKGFGFGGDAGFAVLWVPFLLYYRLTTTHTNTIYELPYSSTDPIMTSDGTYGWQTESYSLMEMLGDVGNSGIGQLFAKGLGSTIKVNVMPSFDPTRNGGVAAGSTITVTLDLINDSVEAAVNNFLFCHTLFGNNRWLQYGFVQASGSLYDVKLPGANRYFMCTGKFRCESRGAFRSPSDEVVQCIFKHRVENNFEDALNGLGASMGKGNDELLKELQRQQAMTRFERSVENSKKTPSNISSLNRRYAINDFSSFQTNQLFGKQINTTVASVNTTMPTISFNQFFSQKPVTINKNGLVDVSQSSIIVYDKAIKGIVDEQKRIRAYNMAKKLNNENSALYLKQNDLISDLTAHEINIDANGKIVVPNAGFTKEQQAIVDSFNKKTNEITEKIIDNNNKIATSFEEAGINFDDGLPNNGDIDRSISLTKKSIEDFKSTIEDTPEFKTLLADEVQNGGYNSFAGQPTADDTKDLIKIPDVYHITMEFGSLIPDNFNTYLYGFREANLDMFKDYAAGNVDETGVFEKLADKLTEALGGK